MLADQWFVVQTNPQRENFVDEQLRQFDPYLPLYKNQHGKIRPLFPGYLFVPALRHWGPIKSTVGVRDLIMAGENPAALSGKEIAKLKAKERGGLVQLPPPPRFRIGERLTIMRGSLRYRTVIYAGMSGRDRERVLIEMLGQNVTLIVPTADLVSDFGRPTRNGLTGNRRNTYPAKGYANSAIGS
jgi:transcriptional antiterminator RfaH